MACLKDVMRSGGAGKLVLFHFSKLEKQSLAQRMSKRMNENLETGAAQKSPQALSLRSLLWGLERRHGVTWIICPVTT